MDMEMIAYMNLAKVNAFRKILTNAGYDWVDPHTTVDGGLMCLEWWYATRKLTVYSHGIEATSYIKVKGPSTIDDMEAGEMDDLQEIVELWKWLVT